MLAPSGLQMMIGIRMRVVSRQLLARNHINICARSFQLITLPFRTKIVNHLDRFYQSIEICNFHSTSLSCGPKGKKGDKNAGEDDDVVIAPPDLKKYDAKMEKNIEHLVEELSRIRGGRASSDMFQDLRVDAFGSKVPLSEAGQVAMPTPTKMTITAYDADLATPGLI